MNEAAKEIQVAKSVSGSVLGRTSFGDPLSAGRYSTSGATVIDLSSDFPPRKRPGVTRRHERRIESVANLRFEVNGYRTPNEPKWHRLVRRYPNTIGLACVTFPIAVIAQLIVSVH